MAFSLTCFTLIIQINLKMPDFISEKELKDFNETRQKEWERVRKPTDPIKRPEAPIDNRPLWKQLADEKEANDQRVAEILKFGNQVWTGYDDEEANYYKHVAIAGSKAKDQISDEVQMVLKQGRQRQKEKIEREVKGVTIITEKNVSSSSKNSSLSDKFSSSSKSATTENSGNSSLITKKTATAEPDKIIKPKISNQKRRLASIVKVKNHPIKKSRLGLADYSSSSSDDSDSGSDSD